MIALVPTVSLAAYPPFSVLGTTPAQAYRLNYFTREEWILLQAPCARLIQADENGPDALELGVPEFIDREMEGAFGHAATWYMQGFASAVSELGCQSPLTPRAVYRAGISSVDAHCGKTSGNKSFSELHTPQQDAVLNDLKKGPFDFFPVHNCTPDGFSGRSDLLVR